MARGGRVAAKRQQRPSVLVLCEGSCTEPNYIGALVREFGLTAVSVPRNHQTDPVGLVRAAKEALRADPELSTAYVVIDRDTHPSFNEAVHIAMQSPHYGVRLKLVRSVPCFEVWLIYHFEYTRASLSSEEAIARLRQHCPDYDKNSVQLVEDIMENLPRALDNSRRSLADANATGEVNCSSEMHQMVAEFIKMAV